MKTTRSVLSPLHAACNTTLYYLPDRNFFASVPVLLGNPTIPENILPEYVKIFFRVALTYCVRVSELLNLRTCDILPGNRVLVQGLKGSASYIIVLPGIEKFHNYCIAKGQVRYIFPISYMVLYRWAKRIGMGLDVGNRKNQAVTHISRYLMSRALTGRYSDKTASDVLRHRSLKSLSFYTKPSEVLDGKA